MYNILNKYRLKNSLTPLVLFGFVSSLIFISFTLHIHQTKDGNLIVHSHILPNSESGSTGQKHSHTQLELELLKIISANFSAIFILCCLLTSILKFLTNYVKLDELLKPITFRFTFKLRGPPSFSL